MNATQRVYVSLGSNVAREENLRGAITALTAEFGRLTRSPVYANPAVGFSGDDFYNLVIGFDTALPLETVAARLRDVERRHGRHRGEAKFAPRTLDLDVLTYGQLVSDGPPLTLPRSDIVEYAFVLKPLADIAGAELHPRAQVSYATLWERARANAPALTRVPDFFE